MKKTVFLLILIFSIKTNAQKSDLAIFDNLVEKTWRANGNWGDGTKFNQEISYEYSLDSTIVLVNTTGYIDQKRTKMGLRNHGIRQVDKNSKSIKFWEFDIFGGLTKGIVFSKGKNIIYQYEYGDSMITDMWEYVNDSTYKFTIGNYEKGKWKQVYLSTQFIEAK